MDRRLTRRALDSWFPTLARYCGLALLVYAVLVDKGQNPALIPAATGLVFLKTVLNGGGKS
jgi:hypothetical protein